MSEDLRTNNRDLAISEFRRGATHLAAKPVALFLEFTRRCNLACPMCRSAHLVSPELDMTDEIIGRIESELLPFASLVDLRGWGESTLRHDFHDLVIRFAAPGVQLRLVTNGVLSDISVLKSLMQHHALVVVSLDAATPSTLRQLRGAKLERVLETLRELVAWRDSFGVSPANVSINAALSSANLDELTELIALARNIGITKVTLFPLITSPCDSSHLSHVPPDKLTRLLDDARQQADALQVDVQLGCALHESLAIDNSLFPVCIHPWMYCYVDFAGNVGFCDHLNGRSEYTTGNLVDEPFDSIWNSSSMVDLRRAHLERSHSCHLFSPCEWCYSNRYVDFEHLFYPSLTPRIVSNTKRTRLYDSHPDRTSSRAFIGKGNETAST